MAGEAQRSVGLGFTFEIERPEPEPGTRFCETCRQYVRTDECGRDRRSVEDFAAVTSAFPCRFPDDVVGQ